MRSYRLGLMDGDGIGPEIVPATVRMIDAAIAQAGDVAVEWEPLPMGWEAIEQYGDPIPEAVIAALGDLDGWIMGPHDSAAYPSELRKHLNPSGTLRRRFGLYANIRPSRNLPDVPSVVHDTDLVIVRENTEGFYGDRNMFEGTGETMPTRDVALATGVFTRPAVERIVREGFRLAQRRRKHLTVVHKANVLRLSTGMYREVAGEMAPEYPDVTVDDYHIDAAAAMLVRKAPEFDVIVTENMFGDILSDLTGELVGALGTAGSVNASDRTAMAQAAHGSAPDIAGQDRGNPIGMMVSAQMLFRWLAEHHGDEALQRVADRCEQAMLDALADGNRTGDLGGSLGTEGFTDAVVDQLSERSAR